MQICEEMSTEHCYNVCFAHQVASIKISMYGQNTYYNTLLALPVGGIIGKYVGKTSCKELKGLLTKCVPTVHLNLKHHSTWLYDFCPPTPGNYTSSRQYYMQSTDSLKKIKWVELEKWVKLRKKWINDLICIFELSTTTHMISKMSKISLLTLLREQCYSVWRVLHTFYLCV